MAMMYVDTAKFAKLQAERDGLLAAMGFQQGDIEACAERLIRIRIIEAYKPLIKELDVLAARVEELEGELADVSASAEYWQRVAEEAKDEND